MHALIRSIAKVACTIALVTLATAALASTPPAPTNVKAVWDSLYRTQPNSITLTWNSTASGRVIFYIYAAHGNIVTDSAGVAWQLVAYSDAPSTVIDMQSQLGFLSEMTVSFKLYVAVYSAMDSTISGWSNIAVATWPPKNGSVAITIRSTPPTTARVNEEYTYRVVATTNDISHPVMVELPQAPGDMAYNFITGDITWTPDRVELDTVVMRAYDDIGTETFQRWTVRVLHDTVRGTLSGSVIESRSLAPVGDATVYAVRVTPDGGSSDTSMPHYGEAWKGITTGLGGVTFSLPEGDYIVHASASGFFSGWADTSRTISHARRYTVVGKQQTYTTTVLRQRPAGVCHITGSVRDASGPIANALVALLEVDGGGAHTGNGAYKSVSATGTFRDSVRRGDTLLIGAFAPGYVSQFWFGAATPLTATYVVTDTDSIQLDFTLTRATTPSNAGLITGAITPCDTTGVYPTATVLIARLEDTMYFPLTAVEARYGVYTFSGLDSGRYLVEAIPHSWMFGQGYYSQTHPCTHRWREATEIVLGSGDTVRANILVPMIHSPLGFASVSGHVTVIGPAPAPTYVRGAVVSAIDSTGAIAAYAVSDAGGAYTINGLYPGTYTLDVDLVGYRPTGSTSMQSDYDARSMLNVDLTTRVMGQVGVEDHSSQLAAFLLGQNYPNPARPATLIAFALPSAMHVDLALFDATGRRVSTLLSGNQCPGEHSVPLDASLLPAGWYVYQLRTPMGCVNRSMVIVK
jgi:hypothetical protein